MPITLPVVQQYPGMIDDNKCDPSGLDGVREVHTVISILYYTAIGHVLKSLSTMRDSLCYMGSETLWIE